MQFLDDHSVESRPRPSETWSVPPHRKATVCIGGRSMRVTDAFWSYWYLAAERQAMFMRRANGVSGPATTDPILGSFRFTNAYRASDRVSQYMLQRVIYNAEHDELDTTLRVLLFKIFNRIETWEHLLATVGEPTVATFDPVRYASALDSRFDADERLYSAAYIMPSPNHGHRRKHANHLALLEHLLVNGTLAELTRASSLQGLFQRLVEVPSFGSFLAFQYAIDLNYGPHLDFDEMEFVVAGPGALRGISKCFVDTGALEPGALIRAVAEAAPRFQDSSGTTFSNLWGRPLQLIDCQNLFCEVDKYSRVAHPTLGHGGPTRIKQNYRPDPQPLTLGYPPKWGLPWSAANPVVAGHRSLLDESGAQNSYGACSNRTVRV